MLGRRCFVEWVAWNVWVVLSWYCVGRNFIISCISYQLADGENKPCKKQTSLRRNDFGHGFWHDFALEKADKAGGSSGSDMKENNRKLHRLTRLILFT